MAGTLIGRRAWGMSTDDVGHRDYFIDWLIQVDDPWNDGPGTVFVTPGTPLIGSVWAFGNEIDPWAFCRPKMTASPLDQTPGEPAEQWILRQTFSTKPLRRDQSNRPDNPLLEPPKISGGYIKYTKEATHDKDGKPIKSSSHEVIKGPAVERDYNRPTITIQKNFLVLPGTDITSMIDTRNDAPLWGFDAGQIKLSAIDFTKLYYRVSNPYYQIKFDFDTDKDAFKKLIADAGTKVLRAGGDEDDPADFVQNQDALDNPAGVMLLDGHGNELASGADPVFIGGDDGVQFYPESNFLLLGVPASL